MAWKMTERIGLILKQSTEKLVTSILSVYGFQMIWIIMSMIIIDK